MKLKGLAAGLLLLAGALSCGEKEKAPLVAGITVSERSLVMRTGDVASLTVAAWPEGVAVPEVTWASSNPAVATVADGTVTAVSEGVATISARTVDGGFEAGCLVSVVGYPVEGILLTPGEAFQMKKGETVQFHATVTPERAANKAVVWESSDETVLTVDDTGLATARAVGTANVTAKTVDGGFTATVSVTVTARTDQGEGGVFDDKDYGNYE
ncbi:MAG: Ig domain-containing protein [Bacteroidales bacterium]|nr:Ig domain-containing protein [Bacteroidales bacterium]